MNDSPPPLKIKGRNTLSVYLLTNAVRWSAEPQRPSPATVVPNRSRSCLAPITVPPLNPPPATTAARWISTSTFSNARARSREVRRPAGAARIAGMQLTTTEAVATSPCVPPGTMSLMLGWPVIAGFGLAWLPVILGLIWPQLNRKDWLLMIPPAALIAAHLLYWARSGGLYGPRYYSEGLPFLWLVAARGLIKMGSTPWPRRALKVLLPILILWTIGDTEAHLLQGFSLYNIDRHDTNLIAAADLHHALVFVSTSYWTDFANLAWLNQPLLDRGDIIFAKDSGEVVDNSIAQQYPDRKVYYYDRKQNPALVAGR